MFSFSYEIKDSIPWNYPLCPLVNICAKYLLQFDSNVTDYLDERWKFLIIKIKSISKRDLVSLTFFFLSIWAISTSARNIK